MATYTFNHHDPIVPFRHYNPIMDFRRNLLIVPTGVIITRDVGANKPSQLVAGVKIPQTINLHGYMCHHHGGHTRATATVMEEMGSGKHSQLVVGSLSAKDDAI